MTSDKRGLLAMKLVIGGMLLLLTVELFGRIRFPYDLYFASESPFMTNMLKLDSGTPLWTPIEQMNSHIYAPGLEYLYYWFAKPLGIVHDVRFARLFVVLLGVGAAGAGVSVIEQVAGRRAERWLTGGVLLLVLFKNFSADMVHPDNLHMLHSTLTLAFALASARRRSIAGALLTIVWATLGVWAKQTAALTAVGVLLGFVLLRLFSRRQTVWLVMTAIVGLVANVGLLWRAEFGRFYSYELSLLHDIFPAKLLDLPRLLLAMPHKLILLLLLPFALNYLWVQQKERVFPILWGTIGAFGTGASLIAYSKAFGTWNNLGIFDLWAAIPVLLLLCAWRSGAYRPPMWFAVVKWGWVTAFAVLTLLPLRVPPPPSYYRFVETWQRAVSADLVADRQILIANGTALKTRRGDFSIPLDRAAAATDLKGADIIPHATHSRIAAQTYERIYLNVPNWYADTTLQKMADHYTLVEQIDAPQPPLRYLFGYQKELFETVLILEPIR